MQKKKNNNVTKLFLDEKSKNYMENLEYMKKIVMKRERNVSKAPRFWQTTETIVSRKKGKWQRIEGKEKVQNITLRGRI